MLSLRATSLLAETGRNLSLARMRELAWSRGLDVDLLTCRPADRIALELSKLYKCVIFLVANAPFPPQNSPPQNESSALIADSQRRIPGLNLSWPCRRSSKRCRPQTAAVESKRFGLFKGVLFFFETIPRKRDPRKNILHLILPATRLV